MSRRLILVGLSFFLLAPIALAQNPPTRPLEHVRYYLVFRHLAILNQKAAEAERKGEDSTKFRQYYKNKAMLSDQQASQLNQIANDCLREVGALDSRIKQIVSESRAKFPGGKLDTSAHRPEPTAGLREIDKERDLVMRRHYTRLRAAFGEVEFIKFNELITKTVRADYLPPGVRESGPRKPPQPAGTQK
jgi:hypothetical protein